MHISYKHPLLILTPLSTGSYTLLQNSRCYKLNLHKQKRYNLQNTPQIYHSIYNINTKSNNYSQPYIQL